MHVRWRRYGQLRRVGGSASDWLHTSGNQRRDPLISGLDNPIHLLIVALIVLLLFGAKRLPEMGRALGSGIREFKDGVLGQTPNEP